MIRCQMRIDHRRLDIRVALDTGVSTIYRWTHEGFIPFVKMGRFVRFRSRDIEKWVDERAMDGRKTRRVDVRELWG